MDMRRGTFRPGGPLPDWYRLVRLLAIVAVIITIVALAATASTPTSCGYLR